MDLQLSGRRALVTGSSSGLGEATAIKLASEGAHVIVHGRNADRTNKVAERIRAKGGQAMAVTGDLCETDDLNRVADEIGAQLGGIDILVNNAGGRVAGWSHTEWLGISAEDWMATYRLNVIATINLIERFVPGMKERGWGRTIQIASCIAIQQPPRFPDYQAAKAAEMNLSRSLSKSLAGSGVTSNSVGVGIIHTPGSDEELVGIAAHAGMQGAWQDNERAIALDIFRQTVGRVGRPDDVANAVAFLASPCADFISGTTVMIEGGMC